MRLADPLSCRPAKVFARRFEGVVPLVSSCPRHGGMHAAVPGIRRTCRTGGRVPLPRRLDVLRADVAFSERQARAEVSCLGGTVGSRDGAGRWRSANPATSWRAHARHLGRRFDTPEAESASRTTGEGPSDALMFASRHGGCGRLLYGGTGSWAVRRCRITAQALHMN